MKLFWKIFISIFFSFAVTVSFISYIISHKQIAEVEDKIIEDTKILGSFIAKEIYERFAEEVQKLIPFELRRRCGRVKTATGTSWSTVNT